MLYQYISLQHIRFNLLLTLINEIGFVGSYNFYFPCYQARSRSTKMYTRVWTTNRPLADVNSNWFSVDYKGMLPIEMKRIWVFTNAEYVIENE